MRAPMSSAEEMAEKVGGRGESFVALDDKKVVGTASIAIKRMSLWCGNEDYGFFCLAGVLPDYAGRGIYRRLCTKREDYSKTMGLNKICFDTNEKNSHLLSMAKKNGFLPVDLKCCGDHYNVILVKWIHGSPYPRWYSFLQYKSHCLFRRSCFIVKTLIKRVCSPLWGKKVI